MFALDDYLKRTTGQNDALNIEYLIELSERLPSLKHWGSYKTVLFNDYKLNTMQPLAQNLTNKVNANYSRHCKFTRRDVSSC